MATTADATPAYQLGPPVLRDSLQSDTSAKQEATVDECLPGLRAGAAEAAALQRDSHVRFLRKALGGYPAAYAAMDASRPWLIYWSSMGLHLLGEDLAADADRLLASLAACQNATGGFGGGHGQLSHLATSYAAVLALLAGADQRAYDLIDRKAMYAALR